MKVKTLLAVAENCETEEGAGLVLEALRTAFEKTSALGELPVYNDEAWLETTRGRGVEVAARAEFVNLLNGNYAQCVVPEIRGGELSVVVRLDHFKDGLGMQSRDYESLFDTDEDWLVTAEEDETITSVANKAKALALELHARLIESVGVSADIAMRIANRAWRTPKLARPY